MTPKPSPCRCPAIHFPHRPMSVKGCEADARFLADFYARAFARMNPDSARAIKAVVGALEGDK